VLDVASLAAYGEQVARTIALKSLHGKIDANEDGKISMSEVMEFSKTAHLDSVLTNFEGKFSAIDDNKDGKVSLDELIHHTFKNRKKYSPTPESTEEEVIQDTYMEAKLQSSKDAEAQKFAHADADGDGFLTEDELLVNIYPEIHPEVFHVSTSNSFSALDTDGDGELTAAELYKQDELDGTLLESAVRDPERFAKMDLDGDGKLDHEEFSKWELDQIHGAGPMQQLFAMADSDNDQHITVEELEGTSDQILRSNEIKGRLQSWANHYEL